MSKPDIVQDYSDVIMEIMQVLSKYKITYYGFEKIIQTITDEVKLFTYIDIDDNLKNEN